VVEEFDDDTDLPLPSMPLPNTGLRGPILQDINDDSDDDDDLGTTHQAGPASPPRQQPFSHHQRSPPDTDDARKVTDITPYKTYVYPLHSSCSRKKFLSPGGHAYIPFISTRNGHTDKDEFHARRAYGGR
jgi:signal recognition particle subunit SRP19